MILLIVLIQFLDLFVELEALKDLADVFGESVDVIGEMPGDIIGIALQFGEVKLAVIVEAQRNSSLILGEHIENGINANALFPFFS